MSVSFELKDRNLLISHNASHYAFRLASALCEMGAQVVLAAKDCQALQGLVEAFNEQRELSRQQGPLHLLDIDLSCAKKQSELFSMASQAMGGIDTWLDYQQFFYRDTWQDLSEENTQKFYKDVVLPHLRAYRQAIEFLRNKRNACVLRLQPEDASIAPKSVLYAMAHAQMRSLLQSLAQDELASLRFLQLEIGPTEDHLLAMYPGTSASECLTSYQKILPQAKLLSSDELAKAIAFAIGNSRSYPRLQQLRIGWSI